MSAYETTLANLTQRFEQERRGDHWEGELASSALSTAVAVIALTLAGRDALASDGARWLLEQQNDDGGWGDTDRSLSNISTSALCWATLTLRNEASAGEAVENAAEYMRDRAGGLDPASLVEAIKRRYGKDHTFSVPILTVLAIAGLLGERGWRRIPQLPFELAAFPQSWYAAMKLPVVSYALPALIAIGQARHVKAPTRNPLTRVFRNAVRERTLVKLDAIQPPNGGFLEATPLTSFVTMSLIVAGKRDHVVVRRGLEFLEQSVRADGSWPIDTNLATWVTTLGVNALQGGVERKDEVRAWLLKQQYRTVHPFTAAPPGAWAWTDLPGGVPDADDTPGALLALHALEDEPSAETVDAARRGLLWLLDLQNADGGIPTFCKGWGALPFDRSSPDLTAHTIRAFAAWRPHVADLQAQLDRATARAVRYLEHVQGADGSWTPLWFGNQRAPGELNLTYGTAKVLKALRALPGNPSPQAVEAAERWLVDAQNDDGSWGGEEPSIEETALAVTALSGIPSAAEAVARGLERLVAWTNQGRHTHASPIGFYFAKLWYHERLYPLVFAMEAFHAVVRSSR